MPGLDELPFRAGTRVTPPFFIDREEQLGELSILMAGLGQHTLVVGQRRVGKSSFLLNAALMARHRNPNLAVVDIDCMTVGSKRDLAERIVEGILSQYQDQHTVKGWLAIKTAAVQGALREALSRIESVGAKSLKHMLTAFVDFREKTVDEQRLLLEALEFAEQFCAEQKMSAIVIFDELQELEKEAKEVYPLLKSQGDRSKHVRYVFSGSAPGVLEKVFFRKDGVLYQMAGKIQIGPLPQPAVRAFIRTRLERFGLHIDDAALDRWVSVSACIPYYVQKLGLVVYMLALHKGTRSVDAALVQTAYAHTVDELGSDFGNRFATKFNLNQRRILMALARKAPRRRGEIASALGRNSEWLSKDLDKLVDWMEVVKEERGVFRMADPIFAAWLTTSRFALEPLRPKRRARKSKS